MQKTATDTNALHQTRCHADRAHVHIIYVTDNSLSSSCLSSRSLVTLIMCLRTIDALWGQHTTMIMQLAGTSSHRESNVSSLYTTRHLHLLTCWYVKGLSNSWRSMYKSSFIVHTLLRYWRKWHATGKVELTVVDYHQHNHVSGRWVSSLPIYFEVIQYVHSYPDKIYHGRPWSSMNYHGRPQATLGDHKLPWSTTNYHGQKPWCHLKKHGKKPWTNMVVHSRPW